MASLTNYVDLSMKSIVLSVVVFLIVVFLSKYILDMYNNKKEEDEKRSFYMTMIYSVVIGLVFGTLTLVVAKQISKMSNDTDILTEPFSKQPSKN